MSPAEKLAIELAEAMTAVPAAVDDELRERLREWFDDRQIVELCHLIAWENARARFNRAFDIDPEGYATESS